MPASLIGAGIGAVGSLASGASSKKGASAAAKAQQQSYAAALAQQQNQFNTTQANLSPYMQAGTGALGAQQTLLGLNGNGAQQSAISALQASPAFTSLYNQGTDAILQNAAATGGLRGGNIENGQLTNSLPGFGSSLLATVIQNQLGNLGGLVSTGANAAAGLSAAGQNNANAQSGLLTQGGQTQAGYGLANSLYGNQTINGLQGTLQKLLAGNGTNLSGVSAGAVPSSSGGGINNLGSVNLDGLANSALF